MTKTQKIALILLALFIVASAVYIQQNKKREISEIEIPVYKITLCFTRNTEDGGKANIVMNIAGDKVTGTFDWAPAERDRKSGPFDGTISPVDKFIMGRTLDVWWNATAEGKTATEQLKIIMGEGNAAPAFGEMKDRGDGVFVYAHPEKLVFEPNLTDVDCKTERVN